MRDKRNIYDVQDNKQIAGQSIRSKVFEKHAQNRMRINNTSNQHQMQKSGIFVSTRAQNITLVFL